MTRKPASPTPDFPISAASERMGRPGLGLKVVFTRLPKDARERIDAVLDDKESRSAFIREAVEDLLRKRERLKLRKPPAKG